MNIHRELELIVKAFEMSNRNKLISPIELSPIFEIFCCCSVDYFRAENLSDLKLNSHRIVCSQEIVNLVSQKLLLQLCLIYQTTEEFRVNN